MCNVLVLLRSRHPNSKPLGYCDSILGYNSLSHAVGGFQGSEIVGYSVVFSVFGFQFVVLYLYIMYAVISILLIICYLDGSINQFQYSVTMFSNYNLLSDSAIRFVIRFSLYNAGNLSVFRRVVVLVLMTVN